MSALSALLSSRGAKVWEAHDSAARMRLPRGVQVAVLESPLPSELRALAAGGMPVIVLAERAEPEDALAAAHLGARALLAKNCTLAELSVAIRSAVGGARVPGRTPLTPRQREVLELIVEGLDNAQIATRLGISERTVRAHVSNVLERTGAANRTQAAVAAIQRGWVATLLLAIALLGLMSATAAAAAVESPAALRAKLTREMRAAGGASGAWVYDGGAGQTVFKWNAATRRVPASVQKLVTTATALDRLGPQTRFETSVLASGEVAEGVLDGDLYLKGSGDPTFGTAALGRLADAVAETGVEQVTGRVYGDESYFDSLRGAARGLGPSPYVGPLSALSFNRGALAPFGRGWQTDPATFTAERLRISLRRDEVAVERGGRPGLAPQEARPLAVVASEPLDAIVRHTNHVSDNYSAEMLLKGLGARAGTRGSTAAGARVARAFARTAGFEARVADGSGLSRANAIAPRDVGRLLLDARREPWFDSFYRSLALAGRTGTLHKRMRGTRAAGRCRAKTGTLAGVSALAGYCRAPDGDPVSFALIMNGVNVFAARRVQDRIAAVLASYAGEGSSSD